MERFLCKQASGYGYFSLTWELIVNLIQRNLSLLPYFCKQSPWEQCLLLWCAFFRKALPCLTQELEGRVPVPGQGWQPGLVTQCQPWTWCWEKPSLHPSAWCKAPRGDGLRRHWHHQGNAGPALRAPQPWPPGLSQCLKEPVPGWGHMAHNCPERKPALYFSRESSEREEIGRCYTRAYWNEFLRSDMTHLRAWCSLCYLSVLLRPYTCIFLTT